MPAPISSYLIDIASFGASFALILLYHLFLRNKVLRNPTYTVQAINRQARTAWVQTVMQERNGILAVQTLRNSTMAATFLASTSVLLIIGVLTLTESDKLQASWHALNIVGTTHQELWLIKIMCLLLDLLVAFFSFAMSIRIFNHVGYLINVPLSLELQMINPANVALHLNRAGSFYSIGMRAYYFTVPLVFWLFGPHFMLIATVGLLVVLYRIDRAPKLRAD
jgi:uncharacterized membrane protein